MNIGTTFKVIIICLFAKIECSADNKPHKQAQKLDTHKIMHLFVQPGKEKEYAYTHGCLIDKDAKSWQNKPMYLWFIASKDSKICHMIDASFKQNKTIEQAYNQLMRDMCHKSSPIFKIHGLLITLSRDRKRHKVDTQNFIFTESKKSKCRFFEYLKKEAILNQLYYALINKRKVHKIRGSQNIIETIVVPYVPETKKLISEQKWQVSADTFFKQIRKNNPNYNPLGLLMIDSKKYFEYVNP